MLLPVAIWLLMSLNNFPETTMMDQDEVLHFDVSDPDLSIDSQVGGHHPGDSQPAPSDQSYPIDKRNLP